MAVLNTDLKLFKSASNNGGAITTTEVAGNNVLGIFSGAETSTGRVKYACVYVQNKAAQTAFNVAISVDAETVHGSVNATIALGNAAINADETAPADDETAPTPALTFVEADGDANAIPIGDLAADAYKAVWIRLDVPAGTAAKDLYGVTLKIAADTGE